jgi:hypothetical protein
MGPAALAAPGRVMRLRRDSLRMAASALTSPDSGASYWASVMASLREPKPPDGQRQLIII